MDSSKFRKFFQKSKNLTAVGTGYIVASAISGLFWIFLASVLEKEEYGELGYWLAVIGTVGAVATVGSSNTLTVYVSKGVKIQSTLFLITFIAGISLSIGLLVFTQNIFVSFYPLAVVIFSTIIFDLLGKKAFVNYAGVLIIQRILMVLLSLAFLQIWGVNGIVFGYTLSLAVFSFLIYKSIQEGKIDFKLLKDRKNFIINNYGINLLEVINVNVDKLIIFPIFGAIILGAYQLGFQLFFVIMVIPNIVTQYTLPHDASGNKNKLLKKYTLIISTIISGLTIIFAPYLIPITFPKFVEAIEVIQIMGFAVVPSALTLILTSELLGNEKSKSVVLGVIVSITVLIVGIILLGEIIGLIGMAVALVLAKYLQCGTLLILKNKISEKSY